MWVHAQVSHVDMWMVLLKYICAYVGIYVEVEVACICVVQLVCVEWYIYIYVSSV